jgi:hypothetical protein
MNRETKTNLEQQTESKGYLEFTRTNSPVFDSQSFSIKNLPNIYYTRTCINKNNKNISISTINNYYKKVDIDILNNNYKKIINILNNYYKKIINILSKYYNKIYIVL